MTLTAVIKLHPNNIINAILDTMSQEYIDLINDIVDYQTQQIKWQTLSSANVIASLPSAIKNQAIRDAKSVYKKYKKLHIIPVLKKPVIYVNNQNYTVTTTSIEIPVLINGKSKRINIPANIPLETVNQINRQRVTNKGIKSAKGMLRITKKNGFYIATISYEVDCKPIVSDGIIMGVDLGIKCPAVCRTSNNNTKFIGNGRQIKYKKRYYAKKRKKLGKAKKLKAIKKLANKEAKWMQNMDHQISRQIVNYAIKNNVKQINLETLANIRATTRQSRKNNKSLHSWSFYRLANYIEYKAALAGIKVYYIDPAYTSQTCPICGKRNKCKDRLYKCSCGYSGHRDLVGAINICKAPVLHGNSAVA